MKSYVLDSFAMIAFFEDEIGANKVENILNKINQKQAKGFMSVINWGELYYNTLREAGLVEAKAVMKQFNQYSIQLIDADKSNTFQAAKLKSEYRIAYADCFAAELSMRLKAPLVTGDPEFKRLSSKIQLIWIEQEKTSDGDSTEKSQI